MSSKKTDKTMTEEHKFNNSNQVRNIINFESENCETPQHLNN